MKDVTKLSAKVFREWQISDLVRHRSGRVTCVLPPGGNDNRRQWQVTVCEERSVGTAAGGDEAGWVVLQSSSGKVEQQKQKTVRLITVIRRRNRSITAESRKSHEWVWRGSESLNIKRLKTNPDLIKLKTVRPAPRRAGDDSTQKCRPERIKTGVRAPTPTVNKLPNLN